MTPTVVLGPCADLEAERTWLTPLAAELTEQQVPVLAIVHDAAGPAGGWTLVLTDGPGGPQPHHMTPSSLADLYHRAAELVSTEHVAFHNNGWDLTADSLRDTAYRLKQLNITTLRYLGDPSDLLFAGLLVARQPLLKADWVGLRALPDSQARFMRGVVEQLGPVLPRLVDRTTAWGSATDRPATTYLVLGTPRTGSTLLCDGLSLVGCAGRPREYLLPGMAAYYYLLSGSRNAADYFAHLHDTESENGVFGAKAHWPHLVSLQRELDEGKTFPFGMSRTPDAESTTDRSMNKRLSRTIDALAPDAFLILTVRADTKAQAVSGFVAQQNESWFSLTGSQEPAGAYDPQAIKALEDRYGAWDAQVHEFLAELARPYLTVEYEDLASNYGETVSEVLHYIGVHTTSVPRPRLRRQAHRTKATILARYRTHADDPL